MSSNDVEIKKLLAKVGKMGEITSGLQQDVKTLDDKIETLTRKVKYLSEQVEAHQSALDAHTRHPAS